jgi:hypothetical protein
MTSNVYYQVAGGFNYVPGTYHSFGNNTTTPYGSSVNISANTALSDLDPAKTNATGLNAAQLLEDLTGASDHLPVVADYTIPLPAPVIASVSLAGNNLSLSVTNGITNAVYTVLAASGLTSGWTPVATNVPATGNFTIIVTNAVAPGAPQQFYLLQTR